MPVLRHHFVLAVPDARATAAFLCDVLGFRVVHQPTGWVFVERDACLVMLGSCPDQAHPSTLGDHRWFGYLAVEDAAAWHAQARARAPEAAGPLEEKPWGWREFVVTTPDGHRLVVGERLA